MTLSTAATVRSGRRYYGGFNSSAGRQRSFRRLTRHRVGKLPIQPHRLRTWQDRSLWEEVFLDRIFELAGWLRDQGMLKERDDDGRSSGVDIDPSFPSPTPEQKLVSTDLLGNPKLSLANWIKKGPTPDLTPYFRQSKILGESGPWVALDGYVVQQDASRGRRLFAFVRSFLVANKEAKAFATYLAKQPLGGRWLPEKPQSYYTFVGEIPWCDTFPRTESTDVKFVIKEQKVKVKRKRPFFFLNGKPVDLPALAQLRFGTFDPLSQSKARRTEMTDDDLARVVRQYRIVEVEELQQEFRKFRTLIPVHEIGWEGRNVDNVSVHGTTLAKQLAQYAELVHLPQTHDLQTKDGVRATYGIAYRPQWAIVATELLRTHHSRRGLPESYPSVHRR
jgi:hypothetical protein